MQVGLHIGLITNNHALLGGGGGVYFFALLWKFLVNVIRPKFKDFAPNLYVCCFVQDLRVVKKGNLEAYIRVKLQSIRNRIFFIRSNGYKPNKLLISPIIVK